MRAWHRARPEAWHSWVLLHAMLTLNNIEYGHTACIGKHTYCAPALPYNASRAPSVLPLAPSKLRLT